MVRKNWELNMNITTDEVRASSQIAGDLMFYLVYTPYDGKRKNCEYWISPIIYIDNVGHIAKIKLIYRSFKENNLESAIRFAESRIATIVEDNSKDDTTTFSFDGCENAIGWEGYTPNNDIRTIKFFAKYKDESTDSIFIIYTNPLNPTVDHLLPIVIKDGNILCCEFKKLEDNTN